MWWFKEFVVFSMLNSHQMKECFSYKYAMRASLVPRHTSLRQASSFQTLLSLSGVKNCFYPIRQVSRKKRHIYNMVLCEPPKVQGEKNHMASDLVEWRPRESSCKHHKRVLFFGRILCRKRFLPVNRGNRGCAHCVRTKPFKLFFHLMNYL